MLEHHNTSVALFGVLAGLDCSLIDYSLHPLLSLLVLANWWPAGHWEVGCAHGCGPVSPPTLHTKILGAAGKYAVHG